VTVKGLKMEMVTVKGLQIKMVLIDLVLLEEDLSQVYYKRIMLNLIFHLLHL
jgi:hypothetical protein